MTQWQQIETAPNDESILVYYNSGDIKLIEEEENDYEWKPYSGKDQTKMGISCPTHWMPLPEPPK